MKTNREVNYDDSEVALDVNEYLRYHNISKKEFCQIAHISMYKLNNYIKANQIPSRILAKTFGKFILR